MMLVVLFTFVGVAVICHIQMWLNQTYTPTQPIAFVVSEGDTFSEVAEKLQTFGLVDNLLYFKLYASFRGSTESIQAGEYLFEEEYSPSDVLNKLVQGAVVSYSVTLIEGGTYQDFLNTLNNAPNLEFDVEHCIVEIALDCLDISDWSDYAPTSHGEGWLYPDTYYYDSNTRASQVLVTTHEKMLNQLQMAWDNRIEAVKFENFYQLLTLASIIEKESSVEDERNRISGVFTRRLDLGMRLQTDPTIIYSLGEAFDGNLTREHLRTDTSYNTYTRHGLPPTPISNPSTRSLEAAAQPAEGDELYFVARGDGTSEFSRTLEQHNIAVRKYQLD